MLIYDIHCEIIDWSDWLGRPSQYIIGDISKGIVQRKYNQIVACVAGLIISFELIYF